MATYRIHNREQIELKMMCINDFVPKNHKARVIVSIVERLRLTKFNHKYNNDGYFGKNQSVAKPNLLKNMILKCYFF